MPKAGVRGGNAPAALTNLERALARRAAEAQERERVEEEAERAAAAAAVAAALRLDAERRIKTSGAEAPIRPPLACTDGNSLSHEGEVHPPTEVPQSTLPETATGDEGDGELQWVIEESAPPSPSRSDEATPVAPAPPEVLASQVAELKLQSVLHELYVAQSALAVSKQQYDELAARHGLATDLNGGHEDGVDPAREVLLRVLAVWYARGASCTRAATALQAHVRGNSLRACLARSRLLE